MKNKPFAKQLLTDKRFRPQVTKDKKKFLKSERKRMKQILRKKSYRG